MERLTKIELNDYIENAGLTEDMIYVLKACYFDPRPKSLVELSIELYKSVSTIQNIKNRALKQIKHYEEVKEKMRGR